jgi:predicted ATPase
MEAIRVRMAINTGEAEDRDGDYFGPTLNRAARLLSAGHGGQVLLAASSQEMARDDLPEGVTLLDLGLRRLKDLTHPEHVFQLLAPDLTSDFPPLRTLDSYPNNLPAQPTLFIGREAELEAVGRRLCRRAVRVVTLLGPGGIGKTRMGVQLGANLLGEFEDGVYLVELAPLRDPSLVLHTVAQTLRIKEEGGRSILDTLRDQLVGRQILLILDNFEQLGPAAREIADLLAACSRMKILVTSREPLHIRGEQLLEMPILSLPAERETSPARLGRVESVRLFVDRAQAIAWDFSLTEENAGTIAELCRRLEGIPLAIELAAARVRTISPQAMLARLQSRLKLLTGGAVDLPERQRTMRATVEWSFNLLSTEQQRLFRRIAVFSGGCTLQAVKEICDRDLSMDVVDGVESLSEKSLLRLEGQDESQQLLMLETIREYGLEMLDASGEADEIKQRHAHFFLNLVEGTEPRLSGTETPIWIARLAREQDNVRSGLAWLQESGMGELALRLATAMWEFWWVGGHFAEGRARLQSLLTEAVGTQPLALGTKAYRLTWHVWSDGVGPSRDRPGAAGSHRPRAILRRDGAAHGRASVGHGPGGQRRGGAQARPGNLPHLAGKPSERGPGRHRDGVPAPPGDQPGAAPQSPGSGRTHKPAAQ